MLLSIIALHSCLILSIVKAFLRSFLMRGLFCLRDNPSGQDACVRVERNEEERLRSAHLLPLWLQSIDLALSRVADRVPAGGHDVPAATVRRRFDRGPHNLFHLYGPLADSWVIFDNSEAVPWVIAKETAGVLTVVDDTLFDEMKRTVGIS